MEFIPMLTLGVLAGALVDRHDRRRLMITSDLLRAASLAGLAVYVLFWGFNAVLVLVTVFALSALGTLFGPASDAILPSLVDPEELTDANGLLTTGETVAQFVGSPLGGGLILIAGVASGLIFNSFTYAVSAICVGLLTIPRAIGGRESPSKGGKGKPSILADVREGFRFLRSQRALLTLTLSFMVINFFSFYNLYIVVYASTFLHSGPAIYGVLMGGSAAGAGVGGLLAGRLTLDRAPGIWIPITWGLSGLPLVSLILFPTLPLAIASMVVLGLLSTLVNVTFLSVVQRTVPGKVLGRYLATDQTIGYSMIPAGIVVGGFLIVLYGLGPSFVLAGAATFGLGLALLFSPEVRAWGRLDAPGHVQPPVSK